MEGMAASGEHSWRGNAGGAVRFGDDDGFGLLVPRRAQRHLVAAAAACQGPKARPPRRRCLETWHVKQEVPTARSVELWAALGEPGTVQARNSARALKNWLAAAPSGEKTSSGQGNAAVANGSNAAGKSLTESEVKNAIEVRSDHLLNRNIACKSKLATKFSKWKHKAVDSFVGMAGTFQATVPISIETFNVSARVTTAFRTCKSEQVVFHGTSDDALRGIRKHGLLVPGPRNLPGQTQNAQEVPVKHGQAYGRGIYTSTDWSMAMSYAHDGVVLVCGISNYSNAVERFGLIRVVKREDGIVPLWLVKSKTFSGDALTSLVRDRPSNISRKPQAVVRRARIRRAQEQTWSRTMPMPIGFMETGNRTVHRVFPVDAQRSWATAALHAIEGPGRGGIGRIVGIAAYRTSKATARTKARAAARQLKRRNLSGEMAGVLEVDSNAEENVLLAQHRAFAARQRSKHNQKASVKNARQEGSFTPSDRKLSVKAARILRQRRATRGSRQGPANEEVQILKKLKKKQGPKRQKAKTRNKKH